MCPYKGKNSFGVSSVTPIAEDNGTEGELAYFHNITPGSPADLSGLKEYDIVERIVTEDGTVIENLKTDLIKNSDKVFYPSDGSIFFVDTLRNGKTVRLKVKASKPELLNLNEIEQ